MLKAYLKRLFEVAKTGDAREESYYSSLEELLKAFGGSTDKRHIHITTLPKKTEAGNPDFRIWGGEQNIVGYIEAKEPLVGNLDYVENGEQLKRYRGTFPNLILTNFFEFRLYRSGSLIDKVLLARPFIVHELKTVPPVENQDSFLKLLDKFFSFSLPKAYTAESLAKELAKRTRFLKEQVILEELREREGKSPILGFYEAFQKYLIAGLTQDTFADLYAQTITYGLFAARTRCENGFNRKLAYDYIPRTIGILRDVFRFISLEELPRQMEWIVDDISEVLAVADVNEILSKFYHEGKGKDPVYYFYETFLAKYNPRERKRRGVYYTPESVVSYIVRSLSIVLKEHFDKPDGFAANSVTVLDPAAGTLTFLAEASKLAVQEFIAKYGEGGKERFIKEHILKNFYGFELMMAPYAIGHLKMALLLEELGYKLGEDERFKFYLTNTLEMEELEQTALPGMSSLAEESRLAGKVKKETPILVVLGNPPYSVSSYNHSKLIENIMGLYKEDIRGERNIQILSDDYAKFIRFCHWKLEQSGKGVIGLITKNTYLSTSAFKGMRKKLIEFFDEIYLLNLHGRLYERTPDGGKDGNVFDIRVGTAIILLIKNKSKKSVYGKLYYSDCFGLQGQKYSFLNSNDITTTKWEEVALDSENFFFEKKEFKNKDTYRSFIGLENVLLQSTSGITTHRDHFILANSYVELRNKLQAFLSSTSPLELLKQSYALNDTDNFKLQEVKQSFSEIVESKFGVYFYKPFSSKIIYYDRMFIDRDRYNIMQHFLLGDNLGLVIKKRHKDREYHHVCVADALVDKNYLSGQTYIFPLYLYPAEGDMFKERKPNLNPKVTKSLAEVYRKEPTPEEIFYYIYGILYSNIYRSKYAEFLKIDFPKVPFTRNYELFNTIGKYGSKLVDLHLMKAAELNNPIAKFQGSGDYQVKKPKYNEKEKRVYINDDQYFEGIEREVWEYQIGGYQVLDKWLNDREKLSLDDIKHYCQIATALEKTIEIQRDIDNIYLDIEVQLLRSVR